MIQKDKTVLVTGATGYLGSHCIKILLERGFKVRGTVRNLSKKLHEPLYEFEKQKGSLKFIEADLMDEHCWLEATKDVNYILHVAQPCPIKEPKDPNEVIKPAITGVRNVFSASLKNNVEKVILTSSTTAVAYGKDVEVDGKVYNEEDFSSLQQSRAYNLSKLKAEKEAWKIYEQNKNQMNLTVMCPGIFLGPIIIKKPSPSLELFSMFWKYVPTAQLSFSFVDVRDVALAQVLALEQPEKTKGKRYIISQDSYWFKDVKSILQNEFSPKGYKFNTGIIPNWVYKCYSYFDNSASQFNSRLGKRFLYDNSRSINELGLNYIDFKKTVIDCGYSAIKFGFIENKLQEQFNQKIIQQKFNQQI